MTILDRILASSAERADAAERAAEAIRLYGDDAEAHLLAKLDDPRRRRSRRAIRLAVEKVREVQPSLVGG